MICIKDGDFQCYIHPRAVSLNPTQYKLNQIRAETVTLELKFDCWIEEQVMEIKELARRLEKAALFSNEVAVGLGGTGL